MQFQKGPVSVQRQSRIVQLALNEWHVKVRWRSRKWNRSVGNKWEQSRLTDKTYLLTTGSRVFRNMGYDPCTLWQVHCFTGELVYLSAIKITNYSVLQTPTTGQAKQAHNSLFNFLDCGHHPGPEGSLNDCHLMSEYVCIRLTDFSCNCDS